MARTKNSKTSPKTTGLSEEGRRLLRATRGASRKAIEETFALGLPITYLKRGRLYHRYPDGREELVSEKEMLEVAGFIYP